MSADAHLAELTEKHKALEKKISEESAHAASDDSKITRWKREKLRLKDEIERLRATLH
ncbi:MAG: hypothetical protein RLZ98_1587 [Pseudomonadota bacterium]|jgi:hypothetical protein